MRVEGFTFFENNQMEEVIITSLSPSSASDGRQLWGRSAHSSRSTHPVGDMLVLGGDTDLIYSFFWPYTKQREKWPEPFRTG